MNPNRERVYSEELLEEYKDICKAGFKGTIDDYLEYKRSYGRLGKKLTDDNPFSDDTIPF